MYIWTFSKAVEKKIEMARSPIFFCSSTYFHHGLTALKFTTGSLAHQIAGKQLTTNSILSVHFQVSTMFRYLQEKNDIV